MPSYDPFKDLQNLVNQALTSNALTNGGGRSLAMPMDLYTSGEDYIAQIDLPGVDPNSIDIDVEDRTITVRAERHHPNPHTSPHSSGHSSGGDTAQGWVTRERSFGTYARQITVGAGLALDRISADYTDGVLTLTIPVAEEAKPRKIQVHHGAPAGKGHVIPGQVEDHHDSEHQGQQESEQQG